MSEAPTAFYRIHGAAMADVGSEAEVSNLAASVAMWYGNTLKPYRVPEHHAALVEFGRVYGVGKLQHLLNDARTESNAWRLPIEQAFEGLLVADPRTRRFLAKHRAKRRLEIAAPIPAGGARRLVRALKRRSAPPAS